MKQLRQYIREILLESINPSINAQISKLEDFDAFIDIVDRVPNSIDVRLLFFDRARFNQENGRVFSLHQGAAGNCNNAMIVGGDGWGEGTYAREGLGPLLYDITMEGTTFLGKTGLGPDHTSVSDDAYAVWNYYLNNRPDVIAKQRDITQQPRTEDVQDDCTSDNGVRAVANRFPGGTGSDSPEQPFSGEFLDHWFDPQNPLSKTYHKTGTPVLDSLRQNFRLLPGAARFIGMPYNQDEMQQIWDQTWGKAYPKNHVKVPWISNIWKKMFGFDTTLLKQLNPQADWEKYER